MNHTYLLCNSNEPRDQVPDVPEPGAERRGRPSPEQGELDSQPRCHFPGYPGKSSTLRLPSELLPWFACLLGYIIFYEKSLQIVRHIGNRGFEERHSVLRLDHDIVDLSPRGIQFREIDTTMSPTALATS